MLVHKVLLRTHQSRNVLLLRIVVVVVVVVVNSEGTSLYRGHIEDVQRL